MVFRPEPSVVDPELQRSGPNVIGGTGGSGTRALASIVRRAGLFTGTRLNASDDAVELGEYSDRWINAFLLRRHEDAGPLDDVMRADLATVLADHLRELPSGCRWG